MVASGAEERLLAFQDKVNTKQLQLNIGDFNLSRIYAYEIDITI